MDASTRAAEAQGFSAGWGGRLVRTWVSGWVKERSLPTSARGKHVKSFTLLSDPKIKAELRSFVRSNKWAIDPKKLSDFTAQKLAPDVAKKYLKDIVRKEIPCGMKKYLEVELFPRIHLKANGKGISLQTARRWLHQEGFRYMEHKKALYYDGHERPDVVAYRQNEFIPQMKKYRERLVEYVVGDVDSLVDKPPPPNGEKWLILVAQDEMTAQANNDKGASWVYKDEHPIKKKGVGRGIHQSDVINSVSGWMKDASETIEYGKNHDGYWNGDMFAEQVQV